MKKIVSLILVIVMAAALIGCGGSGSGSDKLVMATSPDFPPFEYLEGGKVVGIEVEILEKVAAKMGVELVIEQMDFDSVIPGVQAGKFDVGVSGITATEERKQNMDFSDTYFMASQAIVVTPGSPSEETKLGKNATTNISPKFIGTATNSKYRQSEASARLNSARFGFSACV